MIISQYNQGLIKYTPENKHESKSLVTFPGLLEIGVERFSTSKPHVVANLIERFKAKNFKLDVDEYVFNCVNGQFKLKEIPESFKFFTKPLLHQLLALRFLFTIGSAGLLLEAGMGKTKIILDYIALLGFRRSIIIAPKALLFVWEDEALLHRPDKKIYIIKTTDWESEKEAILAADIVVTNYNKAVILEEQLKTIKWDYMNLDEFLIKDPTSLRTQAITRLSYLVPNKTGASGTLVNNTPLDVFAPVRFLEPSLTGYSFAKFRNEYAVTRKAKGKDENEIKVIVGFRRIPEIKSILHSCSIVMTKDEWLKELPGKTFHDVITLMSDEQREHYQNLAFNYITKLEDGRIVEIDNPLVAICKLLQIANGFLYLTDNSEEQEWLTGSTGKKKKPRETYFFKEQPKADKVINLLSGVLSKRKVILWYNYSAERTILEQAMSKNGITYITIAGGEKDTGGKVKQFNSTQGIRVLLCQAKSVNYGITVLGSKEEDLEKDGIEVLPNIDTSVYTQIFYSLSFSLETYLQQQDRCHRIGQTNECDYYHILSNSMIERDLVDKLKLKLSLREDMLTDIMKEHGHQLFTQSSETQESST